MTNQSRIDPSVAKHCKPDVRSGKSTEAEVRMFVPEKLGDISIIGECCTQADNTDNRLAGFDLEKTMNHRRASS